MSYVDGWVSVGSGWIGLVFTCERPKYVYEFPEKNLLFWFLFLYRVFFVRDGIHSDADYNSTRVGVVVVVVVVVVVYFFTMG